MSFQSKYTSAEEAVKLINSGDRVFIHSVAAAPMPLIHAMTERAPELEDIKIVHLHTEGEAPTPNPNTAIRFIRMPCLLEPMSAKR